MVLLLLATSPTLHAALQRLLGVAGWSYMALWPVTQAHGVVAFSRYFKLLTHFYIVCNITSPLRYAMEPLRRNSIHTLASHMRFICASLAAIHCT